MWSQLANLLLISGVCLAAGTSAEDKDQGHISATQSLLRSRRMVGGTLAIAAPWQALVYLGDTVFDGGYAGGVLISERWVLTAGRNLFINKTRLLNKGLKPLIPKVYLGILRRHEANSSNEVAVEQVYLHPEFQNTSDWDNDLALLRLQNPVTYKSNVINLPLPDGDEDMPQTGTLGVIAGWGWGPMFTFSDLLKYIVVPVADQQACELEYSGSNTPKVDHRMFCTGPGAYQENVCFGDSGGPLVIQDPIDGRKVYIAGILSYDKSCGVQKYAVYMKVSYYLPWIKKTIKEAEDLSLVRSVVMGHFGLGTNLQSHK